MDRSNNRKRRADAVEQIPPHSPEAERGVIGSVLLEPTRLAEVTAIVEPVDFHVPAHRTIFSIVVRLMKEGRTPDVPSIVEVLKAQGEYEAAGGSSTLLDIVESLPTAANAAHFAESIRDHATRRRTIDLGLEVASRATNGESIAATLAHAHAEAERLSAQTAGTADAKRLTPIVVCMADVKPRPVEWLWPGRIALGKLTVIAGDPGLGKSFLTCDLAARVSIGSPWPDDPSRRAPLGRVVLMNFEDDLADTIRPRLDRHGADVERIGILTAVRDAIDGNRERQFDLSRDLDALEQAIVAQADCKLVVIDPVMACLGRDTDSHKTADVRALLAPLSELAARHRVAIVAVSHLNKGNGPAMYRTSGSLAFVAAARAVWCATKDKDNPQRRLFLPVKNNLGNDLSGLAYAIVDGMVAWERDAVTVTADEALTVDPQRRGPEADERTEAADYLRRALAGGPRLTKEVEAEAREGHGIALGTLKRARSELGVVAYQTTIPGPWWLALPNGDDNGRNGPTAQQPAPLAPLASNAGEIGIFAPDDSPAAQVSERESMGATDDESEAAEWSA